MIKYILLIICIVLLFYILFKYCREGFYSKNISILDISKNLLIDNS